MPISTVTTPERFSSFKYRSRTLGYRRLGVAIWAPMFVRWMFGRQAMTPPLIEYTKIFHATGCRIKRNWLANYAKLTWEFTQKTIDEDDDDDVRWRRRATTHDEDTRRRRRKSATSMKKRRTMQRVTTSHDDDVQWRHATTNDNRCRPTKCSKKSISTLYR